VQLLFVHINEAESFIETPFHNDSETQRINVENGFSYAKNYTIGEDFSLMIYSRFSHSDIGYACILVT